MVKRFSYSSFALTVWVACAYMFLYVPLFILMIFSFNSIAFPYRWESFSLRWYQELFTSVEIWHAAMNSLIVAACSVFFSLAAGLMFVLWNAQRKNDMMLAFFYPNLVVPEIVLAVGLLSFFVFFNVPFGLTSLIVGHTLLGLGYAIPILHARVATLDYRLIEASLDLGATQRQTFFKIIIPLVTPSLVAAGLLVFILSLDDFLIAFFCAGTSAQTLSLYIYAMIRGGVSPVINALATCMAVVSSILVAAFCSLRVRAKVW